MTPGAVRLRITCIPIALLALIFPAAAPAGDRSTHIAGVDLQLIHSGDTQWHVFHDQGHLLMIRVVPERGLPHYFVPLHGGVEPSSDTAGCDIHRRDARARDVRRVDWTQAPF
jgi:hypothetical protein